MKKLLLYLLKLLGWKEKRIIEKIEVIKEVEVIKEKAIEIIKEIIVEERDVIIQEKIIEVPVIHEKIVEKEVEKIVVKEIIKAPPLTKEQEEKIFWDNKYPKSDIVYYGRILKNEKNIQTMLWNGWQIPVDVKAFILDNDEILKYIINQYGLIKSTHDETMLAIQKFVCSGIIDMYYASGNYTLTKIEGLLKQYIQEDRCRPAKVLTYAYDDEKYDAPDYWLFPFESVAAGFGDCEDGAILIAALAINAGIPNYKVKVACGYVCSGNISGDTYDTLKHSNGKCDGQSCGGHAYCIYLASDNEWRIIDWCYWADYNTSMLQKPLAKNGGYNNYYKDIWFTFNNEYSWNQKSLNITGRLDYIDTLSEICL
jgi:hypothetical protein